MKSGAKKLILGTPAAEPLKLGTYFPAQMIDAPFVAELIELLATQNPAAGEEFGSWLNEIQPGPGEDDELYEILDRITDALSHFGPPYAYFGTYEADASWGMWPNREALETDADHPDAPVVMAGELVDRSERFREHLSPEELAALEPYLTVEGQPSTVEYIWDGGWANLWDRSGRNVWNPY
jgi:hypothetical protein